MSGLGDSAAGAIDAVLSRLRMIRSSDPAERRTGIITAAVVLLFSCCGLYVLAPNADEPQDDAGGIQPAIGATMDVATAEEPPTDAPATPTEQPEPTVAPTDTEVPPTVTEPPPTEAPTAVPPTAVPPTAAPAFAFDPPCQDKVNCGDFSATGTDPQAWWNARRSAECPNPGQLDGDNDGAVCEQGEGGVAAPPPPPAPQTSGCINLNTASFDELRRIIHIEEAMAQQIIAIRPFRGWNDFEDRVDGIGPAKRRDIQAEGLACIQ